MRSLRRSFGTSPKIQYKAQPEAPIVIESRLPRSAFLFADRALQSSSHLEAREIMELKAVVSETAKDAVPIPLVFDRNLKQQLQQFTV
jgi:hypothetical protein